MASIFAGAAKMASRNQSEAGAQLTLAEKQERILRHLRESHSREPVPVHAVETALHLDILRDLDLFHSLHANPKLRFTDNNASIQYVSKFELSGRQELLAFLRREGTGIPVADLGDAYPTVRDDLAMLVSDGHVVWVSNVDTQRSAVVFARTEPLEIKLTGSAKIRQGDPVVRPDRDWRNDMVPGEAISIRGHWYRVVRSVDGQTPTVRGEVRDTGGQSSFSMTSRPPIDSKKTFDAYDSEERLPLESPIVTKSEDHAPVTRLGMSADIKSLWRKSRVEHQEWNRTEFPTDLSSLWSRMEHEGMKTVAALRSKYVPGAEERRMSEAKAAPTRKKRRRVTVRTAEATENKHLEGTAVGEALRQARLHLHRKKAKEQRGT